MISYHQRITTMTTSDLDTFLPLVRKTYDDDSATNRPTVSVVIPTLNEAKNLPLVLPFLPMDWVDEVILVDGRSTDNTIEVALELIPSIKIVREYRKGKGVAMRAGYAASACDIIVLLDADGSNDPREIPSFIKRLMQGADMVKGSRFAVGGGTTDMTWVRKTGNRGLALVSNILFGKNFTDLCYGFHAFWRYCLDVLEIEKYDGFEIDTGLYLQAMRKNLRIVEEPSFEGERFHGSSNLNAIRDGIRVLKTILRERFTPSISVNHIPGFRGYKYGRSADNPFIEHASGFETLLSRVQWLLFSQVDRQSLIARILQMTLQDIDAVSGALMLLDNSGKLTESFLVHGESVRSGGSAVPVEVLNDGLAGWVLKNRKPALVSNTDEDPRWLRLEYPDAEYSKSVLAVPLMLGSKIFGVLTLTRPSERQFTESDLLSVQRASLMA